MGTGIFVSAMSSCYGAVFAKSWLCWVLALLCAMGSMCLGNASTQPCGPLPQVIWKDGKAVQTMTYQTQEVSLDEHRMVVPEYYVGTLAGTTVEEHNFLKEDLLIGQLAFTVPEWLSRAWSRGLADLPTQGKVSR